MAKLVLIFEGDPGGLKITMAANPALPKRIPEDLTDAQAVGLLAFEFAKDTAARNGANEIESRTFRDIPPS